MSPQKKRNIIIAVCVAVALIAGGITAFILLQPEPAVEEDRVTPQVEDRPAETEKVATWPLTGLPLEDADKDSANNRPLCIKIENSYDARPQLGIGSADVVYETLTEGGITRFNCIFQSNVPEDVGPVRSARNSDVSLVPQYQGLLFYSGANGLVQNQMAAIGIESFTEGSVGALYHRVDYRAAPHNLYLYASGAYAELEAGGTTVKTETPPTLEFLKKDETNTNATATTASAITIPFSDSFIANWEWNSESGLYYRSMDGPTLDAANDEQIGVANVVIMWAPFAPDPAGGTTLEVDLLGTGKAMVFTNGQWIEGTWEAGPTPPRFKDASGNPILLTPGQSWFSVVDTATEISTS